MRNKRSLASTWREAARANDSTEDALYTYQYQEHFKILPAIHNWSNDPYRIKDGKKVSEISPTVRTITRVDEHRNATSLDSTKTGKVGKI